VLRILPATASYTNLVQKNHLLLSLRVLEFEGKKKEIAIELCQIFFWFHIILEI
jgi:hypothetical protein